MNHNSLTPEAIAKAEKQLGRNLTSNEKLVGRNLSPRPDTRDVRAKMTDQHNFRVILAKPATELSAIDVEVARLEADAHAAEIRKGGPTAIRLDLARQAQAKERETAASEAAHKAHLAKPEIKAAIEKMRGIREQLEWSKTATKREIEEVESAIAQLTTPSADAAIGLERAKAVVESRKSEAQKRHAAIVAGIAANLRLADEAKADLAAFDPETTKEPEFKPTGTFDGIQTLWAEYKAHGEGTPESAAALDKWSAAVDAFGGSEALRPYHEAAAKKHAEVLKAHGITEGPAT